MINRQLLDEKIKQSGLKINFICQKLGISRNAFDRKRKGEIPFRVAEIYVLCDLLGIKEDAEKEKIFYPECTP